MLADQFLLGITEDLAHGRVDIGEMTVCIASIDDVVGVLDKLAVALARFAHFLRGALTLGDVLDDPFIREDASVLVASDCRILADMNDISVAAAPRAFKRTDLAALLEHVLENEALLPVDVIALQIALRELFF